MPISPLLRPLFCCFFSLALYSISAQQLSLYSVMRDNFQPINPAAINHLNLKHPNMKNMVVSGMARFQWMGTEGAPWGFRGSVEQVYYGDNLSNGHRWGVNFSHDRVHATGLSTLGGSYSLLLKLAPSYRNSSKMLSLGMYSGIVQTSIDRSELRYANPGEPQLPTENRTQLDFAGGAFYWSRTRSVRFYTGVSFLNALSINLTSTDPTRDQLWASERRAHVYGIAGAMVSLNARGSSFVEPYLWTRWVQGGQYLTLIRGGAPISADAGLRYHYTDLYGGGAGLWLGAVYSSNNYLTIEFGGSMAKGGQYGDERIIKAGLGCSINTGQQVTLGPTLEFNVSFSI